MPQTLGSSMSNTTDSAASVATLAVKGGRLLRKPHVPLLQEHNVRVGFLEEADMAKVLPLLPCDLAHVVEFAWITSWRVASEVLKIQWPQIDPGTV